jgi:hypothetical protein
MTRFEPYVEQTGAAFTATTVPILLMRHRKIQNDMLLNRESVE